MSILIVTEQGDGHALSVAAGIQEKGGKCHLWYTTDFTSRQRHTIEFDELGLRVAINGDDREIDLADYAVVWNRRYRAPAFDRTILHPDDLTFVETSLKQYHRAAQALFAQLPFGSIWVNDPIRAINAESKLLQLSVAQSCGFTVPKTVVTNDKSAAERFLSDRGGNVIRKSLIPFLWIDSETVDNSTLNATSDVTLEDLPSSEIIGLYPEIYQDKIDRSMEIRAFFFGGESVSVSVTPESTSLPPVDWRRFHLQGAEVVRPFQLPSRIEQLCNSMLSALGLETGSFDLLVDKDGQFHFCELNQAGQFLWMEIAGCDVLEPFVDYLLAFDLAGTWSGRKLGLKMPTIHETDSYRALESRDRHRTRRPMGEVLHVVGQ